MTRTGVDSAPSPTEYDDSLRGYFGPNWRFGSVLKSVGSRPYAETGAERGALRHEPQGPILTHSQSTHLGKLLKNEDSSPITLYLERINGLVGAMEGINLRKPIVDELRNLRKKHIVDSLDQDSESTSRADFFGRPEFSKKNLVALINVQFEPAPIITFPYLVFELDDSVWAVRDVITICGGASQSKIWLEFNMLSTRCSRDAKSGLQLEALTDQRTRIENIKNKMFRDLLGFYRDLLVDKRVVGQIQQTSNEPIPQLTLEPMCNFEILSVMSDLYKDPIRGTTFENGKDPFDRIRSEGFNNFVLQYEDTTDKGIAPIIRFVHWADEFMGEFYESYEPLDAHILNFSNDAPGVWATNALLLVASVRRNGSPEVPTHLYSILCPKWDAVSGHDGVARHPYPTAASSRLAARGLSQMLGRAH